MNVLQAFLAALQCKPLPPRRNRNLRCNAAGRGGTKSGPRNISGLSGTPSTYNEGHSSGAANRSGERASAASTTVPLTVPTSIDSASDGLEIWPKPKKGFARDCVTDVSTTHVCDSQPPESSYLGVSDLTANSSLKSCSVEEDVAGISTEWNFAVDGRVALSLIPENGAPAFYGGEEECGEDKYVDRVGPLEEIDAPPPQKRKENMV